MLYKKTSVKENGVEVSIKPEGNEIIYFFELDNDKQQDLRKYLDIDGDGQKICDYLVYYEESSKKVLCFLELKGSSLSDAVKQISNTYPAINKKLKSQSVVSSIYNDFIWAAGVAIKRNNSPTHDKKELVKLEKMGLTPKVIKKDFANFMRKL